MSSTFYKFIANTIINYVVNHSVKPGDKFHIQFEHESEVKNLLEALKVCAGETDQYDDFVYVKNGIYNSFTISNGEIEVLVAGTIGGVTADFLTTLRNLVGTAEPSFENKAILFVHHTTLDSIIKGTVGFQDTGMPLSSQEIKKYINDQLQVSSLNDETKTVLGFILEKVKERTSNTPRQSVFEYEDILKSLDRNITVFDYPELGLFPDHVLPTYNHDHKSQLERLKNNYELFNYVNESEAYGDLETDLERYFDDDGIKKILEGDWKRIEYSEIKQFNQNRLNMSPPSYLEENVKQSLEGLSFWERPEGETKAKSRKRHLIVFNPDNISEVNIEFLFDRNLKSEYLKNVVGDAASVSRRKIKFAHHFIYGETNFLKFRYKEQSATFEFNIAIVSIKEEFFESIQTNFLIGFKGKQGNIKVLSTGDTIKFNEAAGETEISVDIEKGNEQINFTHTEAVKISKSDEYIQNQGGELSFDLVFNDVVVPLIFVSELPKSKIVKAIEIYKLKREKEQDFKIDQDNKLVLGNQDYQLKDQDYINSLEIEKEFIKQSALALEKLGDKIQIRKLDLPSELEQAYLEYIDYFQSKDLLPSLAYWTPALMKLAKRYIDTFIAAVEQIEEGATLSSSEKNLTLLGTVTHNDELKTLSYSPLHPINVAYQYYFFNQVQSEEVPIEIIQRLNSKNLSPYIYYDNEIYKPVDQNHSPEWNYFHNYRSARYNLSTSFVSKLVADKIYEFTNHYNYLFNVSKLAPIKLNLINLGDCREVLQGIFLYYLNQLKKNAEIDHLNPIEIFIYGENDQYNSFEEISFYSHYEEIEKVFNISLKNSKYSEEDVLNAFRRKVQFFKKELKEDQELNYAHITFYELAQYVDETIDAMDKMETGISLNGLFSSSMSSYIGNSYRTGFGTKYLCEERNELLRLAALYNSLMLASGRQNPYDSEKTIVTAFSNEGKEVLNKIYDASHWVTFIEPKFDLSFFTEGSHDQDLLILHYSDQYTPSNNYDAITVTRRTRQFQSIIEEFLSQRLNTYEEDSFKRIINLFNSLNGNWLLRMIGDKSQFSREKMSILSAVKFALSFFAHDKIIWIPLSLEEILRVSGAVGLAQKESLFSASNLGITGAQSDDLLMIGIEIGNERPIVHFYPVEVKIGNIQKGVLEKAYKQVTATSRTIIEKLTSDSFTSQVYRDFLSQLAIISAKKMKLYKVWPENDWDVILNDSVRTNLLSDNYDISTDLNDYIGNGGIITFAKDNYFRSMQLKDEVLTLSLTEQDGYEYLSIQQEELFERLHRNQDDFPKDQLLWNIYKKKQVYITDEDNELEGNDEVLRDDNGNDLTGSKGPYDDHVAETLGGGTLPDKEPLPTDGVDPNIEPMKILFGTSTSTGKDLYWYPTTTSKIMHTNTGIIGTMGTGKTQFTKSLIKQLSDNSIQNVNSTPLGILIFDYKGDYIKADFVEATGAKVYHPYHLPFNPLAIFEGTVFKPLLPLHTASSIKETIATAFNLGPKQQQFLNDVILAAYESKGIKRGDRSTWQLTPPTFQDVYNKFINHDEMKEDSLYAALKQIYDFEIFSPNAEETMTLYDLVDGITVINLAGYDRSVQNLVVGITLDTFHSQMSTKGHSTILGDYRELTKMILVDEADNFISQEFSSLKKIMKEGREFGVGTILSTQFMSHFATNDNDYSQYILTWVVHRVPSIKKKEVQSVFNPETVQEIEQITNKIAQLEKHRSLVTSVSDQKYEVMEDMAFWKLISEYN
ncbi:DNA phosphorothioation-dependent restriction protein DptH [Metabacillus fastidiosus]|uniref:DNA phosphorothioation-dependent restriction protein DptH n=1 Tax=Metabacillus fastidiosus TaxID=1458 RepID=UPI000825B290|nr:DNA phosphorothioation-dependent restriction protein DptH [Metabacillus fastidiosus]MED4462717.1 DNA phosphorothioation-dependent restriction protein DptH [Metabacillus fastidiosus]